MMIPLTDNVAEISVAYLPTDRKRETIISISDAYTELIRWFPKETISLQERFVVAYLNRSNRLLGVYEVSKGGMTGTVVDIRLVLATALKVAATSMILAHNHPSGNLKASEQDKLLTNQMKDACALLNLKVIDHLIITPKSYLSFVNEGLI